MAGERTVRQVIDLVIRENRPSEWLCYTLVVVFVGVGVAVIFWGAKTGEGLVALAGSIAAGLFWPALSNLRAIRREKIAVRLLESVLNRAETSEKAAQALEEAFRSIFIGAEEGKP